MLRFSLNRVYFTERSLEGGEELFSCLLVAGKRSGMILHEGEGDLKREELTCYYR